MKRFSKPLTDGLREIHRPEGAGVGFFGRLFCQSSTEPCARGQRLMIGAGYSIMLALFVSLSLIAGCKPSTTSGKPVIGISFETLQTEFWVAGLDAIKAESEKKGYATIEAVADSDANRQLQQVKNFITRRVDGIILVPKDKHSANPAIRAANAAGIPIALFNRPADALDVDAVSVVADNLNLSKETTAFLIEQAKSRPQPVKAMVLIGDLGDSNALMRRDGFNAAVAESTTKGGDVKIEVVAEVPTQWNQEKAQAGVVNALQANPDIGLIFTSSDFLLPSIVSALKSAGKYHTHDKAAHVLLGGFDGDGTAYQMLREGYLDATGVQNVYFEAAECVRAIEDLRAGKAVPAIVHDPGFVIHRENIAAKQSEMWGANLSRREARD